jgi:protein required for attachment to host cells
MRMPKTLYVVADGGRARYIERAGPGHFRTVRNIESAQLHTKSIDMSRDRPPRVQESANPTRHAVEQKLTPRDKVEMNFIKALAKNLDEDEALGSYDNLVLVAPARLERVLRQSLAPSLSAKLVKYIHKDLTKVPDSDLSEHLPEIPYSAGQPMH